MDLKVVPTVFGYYGTASPPGGSARFRSSGVCKFGLECRRRRQLWRLGKWLLMRTNVNQISPISCL